YRVEEEVAVGTFVGDVLKDSGLLQKYEQKTLALLEFLVVPREVPYFSVGETDGVVRTKNRIDRDAGVPGCREKLLCEIKIDVAIKPTRYFEIFRLVIEVIDVNDNSPSFKQSSHYLSLAESVAVGSLYPLPTASDPDSPVHGVQRYAL
ncbi:hypothetical protein HELRODRAFT_135573, partial [Helobdella robusta]|uniref:Cadherin domain-containing protein n=1 Tax=Helobdella robusta TaxID=6412 RepID=T1EI96_HELRO